MPAGLITSMCCACGLAVFIVPAKECIVWHLSPGVYCPALFFPNTFVFGVQFQAVKGCLFLFCFFLFSGSHTQVFLVIGQRHIASFEGANSEA